MATASPILIHSSSPFTLRVRHSATPPAAQRERRDTDPSSSPRLPSPSTFVKRLGKATPDGSTAQAAFDGRPIAFPGVETRADIERLDAMDDLDVEKEDVLVVSQLGNKDRASQKSGKHMIVNEASTTMPPAPAALDSEPSTTVADGLNPDHAAQPLDLEIEQPESAADTKAPKQAKKPRKKPSKPATGENVSAAKKPKKRTWKSEEFVLNSDEPVAEADGESSRTGRTTATDPDRDQRKGSGKLQPVKSATKRSRKKKNDETPTNKDTETEEQSVYFINTPIATENASGPSAVLPSVPATYGDTTSSNLDDTEASVPIIQRRRCWTPPVDTETVRTDTPRPPTAGSEASNASQVQKLDLQQFISDLSYTAKTPSARGLSGEAVTKRRRIELSEFSTTDLAAIEKPHGQALKTPKPAPKQKKKPQTITAVATAAFLPAKLDEPEQGLDTAAIPAQPTVDEAVLASVSKHAKAERIVKQPKKRRKRLIKVIDGPESAVKKGKTPRKRAAATSAKKKKPAKPNEPDPRLQLYPPEHAVAEIRKLDFLFGTSSQLAPAEPPRFIRDVLAALRTSEDDVRTHQSYSSPPLQSSQGVTSPSHQICTRVPTAPHGTSLSLGQAARGLWCVAARDFEGNLLRTGDVHTDVRDEHLIDDGIPAVSEAVQAAVDMPAPPEEMQTVQEENVIAIHSSPLVAPPAIIEGFSPPKADRELTPQLSDILAHPETTIHQSTADEDSWMLLDSDDSVLSALLSPDHPPARAEGHTAQLPSPLPSRPTQGHIPMASRPALHPLDANRSLTHNTPMEKSSVLHSAQAFSSTAPSSAHATKRPRGRSRKDPIAHPDESVSPTKHDQPLPLPEVQPGSSPNPLKPPRTNTHAARWSASAPHTQWLDIDEISDSESPTTPSPPRRSASSSPPAVQPLLLSPSRSQQHDRESKVDMLAVSETLKLDGTQWPEVKAALYPLITETVKIAKGRTTASGPELSWWEKILMYDPIVVEDLTAWLNECGVHIDVRRKVKGGKKGGKRKADAAETAEWELCREPLQAWMVQKWCEEKSICCYLKSGSWRGGRGGNA
ncbi:hypothetical protein BDY17DRAFT_325863 [Neohortaea acidophila]|uniref:Structure-specific endonuclease subunit SLX4 n=1 Tax=Neohortaea acidophila TaxID=245834 RepID=A0A6A6PM42_9PEZI|nr:uncharacterized protein BDY17DRAFT_325863 [Neohortaea acidophila]KAF2481150.1 hypothetical protein BDY17DRAFT_325863 [Neohortaea acidophila]